MAKDSLPGTVEDIGPDDPKDPLPYDRLADQEVPVKDPSLDTTELRG